MSVDFRSLPVAIVLGALTAAGALAAVFALTKYNAICSYVGRQGAVRLAVHGSPYAEPTTELLEFRKATTLWASVTRKNFRGHYAATSYDFCWYAADRQRVLHLVGRFSSREGTPPGSDPYYFALAAELAWSKYLFASLPVRLEQEGSIRFAVRDREALRVGRGFLEIESAGEVQRIEGTELNRVSMENGQFSYATTDARWYSIKGKFNFDYTKLPNARYFVMVVESLVPRVLSGNSTAG
ncbi:MAG: hypothetical protein K8T91_06720 [Planctomycetes bacterium]|nr:hypothetical protein [Planctomycetota bacterium]